MYTHENWVKIDAVHVQPLDFIQEVQLGDCRHLTPVEWLSLSTIVKWKEEKKGNVAREGTFIERALT
jgi:hypothetical protein